MSKATYNKQTTVYHNDNRLNLLQKYVGIRLRVKLRVREFVFLLIIISKGGIEIIMVQASILRLWKYRPSMGKLSQIRD